MHWYYLHFKEMCLMIFKNIILFLAFMFLKFNSRLLLLCVVINKWVLIDIMITFLLQKLLLDGNSTVVAYGEMNFFVFWWYNLRRQISFCKHSYCLNISIRKLKQLSLIPCFQEGKWSCSVKKCTNCDNGLCYVSVLCYLLFKYIWSVFCFLSWEF